MHSRPSLVSACVSLHGDCSAAQTQVFLAGEPASDGLLDPHTSHAEFIGPQFLQICHLSCPEEDLSFPKLVLIWVLKRKKLSGTRLAIITYWKTKPVMFTFNVPLGAWRIEVPVSAVLEHSGRLTSCLTAHPSASSELGTDWKTPDKSTWKRASESYDRRTYSPFKVSGKRIMFKN